MKTNKPDFRTPAEVPFKELAHPTLMQFLNERYPELAEGSYQEFLDSMHSGILINYTQWKLHNRKRPSSFFKPSIIKQAYQ